MKAARYYLLSVAVSFSLIMAHPAMFSSGVHARSKWGGSSSYRSGWSKSGSYSKPSRSVWGKRSGGGIFGTSKREISATGYSKPSGKRSVSGRSATTGYSKPGSRSTAQTGDSPEEARLTENLGRLQGRSRPGALSRRTRVDRPGLRRGDPQTGTPNQAGSRQRNSEAGRLRADEASHRAIRNRVIDPRGGKRGSAAADRLTGRCRKPQARTARRDPSRRTGKSRRHPESVRTIGRPSPGQGVEDLSTMSFGRCVAHFQHRSLESPRRPAVKRRHHGRSSPRGIPAGLPGPNPGTGSSLGGAPLTGDRWRTPGRNDPRGRSPHTRRSRRSSRKEKPTDSALRHTPTTVCTRKSALTEASVTRITTTTGTGTGVTADTGILPECLGGGHHSVYGMRHSSMGFFIMPTDRTLPRLHITTRTIPDTGSGVSRQMSKPSKIRRCGSNWLNWISRLLPWEPRVSR